MDFGFDGLFKMIEERFGRFFANMLLGLVAIALTVLTIDIIFAKAIIPTVNLVSAAVGQASLSEFKTRPLLGGAATALLYLILGWVLIRIASLIATGLKLHLHALRMNMHIYRKMLELADDEMDEETKQRFDRLLKAMAGGVPAFASAAKGLETPTVVSCVR